MHLVANVGIGEWEIADIAGITSVECTLGISRAVHYVYMFITPCCVWIVRSSYHCKRVIGIITVLARSCAGIDPTVFNSTLNTTVAESGDDSSAQIKSVCASRACKIG